MTTTSRKDTKSNNEFKLTSQTKRTALHNPGVRRQCDYLFGAFFLFFRCISIMNLTLSRILFYAKLADTYIAIIIAYTKVVLVRIYIERHQSISRKPLQLTDVEGLSFLFYTYI